MTIVSKQKGSTVIVAAIIIGIAAFIGMVAPYVTKENDSPIEELSESVLRGYDIDVDFSPDDFEEIPESAYETDEEEK